MPICSFAEIVTNVALSDSANSIASLSFTSLDAIKSLLFPIR